MALDVAIQMDPIEGIDISGDSTFALALEAQNRGHHLSYYLTRSLTMFDGRISARVHTLSVRDEKGKHFTLGGGELRDLSTFDVVLMRQDPPFDMSYITATHMLEHIHPKTLVVNDPGAVRNAPEKIFVTKFEGLMPPTLITSDREEILAFRREYRDIIVKPLYGNGGAQVFHVTPNDENFNTILEMFTSLYREPIIVQKYLPAVRQGDKRIILVDGLPAGAINRVPPHGEARSNLHVGGKPETCELSERDVAICAMIGPELKERGLIFVGIDVIGGFLTEINVTSPTGIREIERLAGVNVASLVWDAIEARR